MTNRTMRAGAVALLLSPLAATVSAQAQDSVTTLSDGALQVCLFPDLPPVAHQVPGGSWAGWDVEFLADFAESQGLTFEPVELDVFEGIWLKPGEGVCDIAGGAITDTDERRRASLDAAWSDNYFDAQRAFIVRQDNADLFNGPADLSGRTAISWPESADLIDLQRQIDSAGVADVTIEPAESAITALEAIRDGKAFAFSADLVTARYHVAQHPGLAVAWVHPMMAADGSPLDERYAFVVRKADSGLVGALDAYIEQHGSSYGWPR